MPALSYPDQGKQAPFESCGVNTLRCVVQTRCGQFSEAADCYRKVIEFTRANPEDYDVGFVDSFLELIVKLEACAAEAQRAVNDDDRPG